MGATYSRRGKKSFLVAVHSRGERQYKMVRNEQDAKALVQHIHKQELAGVNVIEAIRKARAAIAPAPVHPKLRDALPEWIQAQRDIRVSTAENYQSRLSLWVYPHTLADGRLLGDLPVNQVTREHLGAVILKMKSAGRSRATIGHICHPLRRYYQGLIEMKTLPPPNPAGDLKFFIGKIRQKKGEGLTYFAQEEGPQLIATVKALWPRYEAFILTGLLAGLRWGESAALYKTDIDWQRGRLHIQRTVSAGGMAPCKDNDDRWVKGSKELLRTLRAHVQAMDLEGQVKGWTPEQRRLVFPNKDGRVVSYSNFQENIWRPLLAKAGLAYRKYHSTRHTFATWLLSDGADLRWVQKQLGHASIKQTADTYGHVQPERHESAVEGLDRYLSS